MSFNVNYWIESHTSRSAKWTSWGAQSLAGHSQKSHGYIGSTEELRVCVMYQRQLKPIEKAILNKLPWLKRHYPFVRLRCSSLYEWKGTD